MDTRTLKTKDIVIWAIIVVAVVLAATLLGSPNG